MAKKEMENGAPRRRRAAAEKNKKRERKILILVICVAVLACACCFIGCNSNFGNDGNVAAKGVCVGDIDLGGKTREEVTAVLAELNGAFSDSEVDLSIEGRDEVKNIKASDIALEFDLEKTVERVFSNKNKGGFFKSKRKNDVGYAFNYDAIALMKIADEFTATAGGDLKEHEISIEGEFVTVKAGEPGMGITAKDAQEAIINSFKPYVKSTAKVSMRKTEPEKMTVDYLYEMTKREKKNAEFVYENGNVTISDEVDGIELDRADAEAKLKGFGVGSKDVKIKLIVTPAEVKKQQLQGQLFGDVLGQYSTKYNAGNVNRTINVELAAKNINGKVLLPGEVFSYNETVGPRTYERGFRSASVYVGSRVESGLGGGICQTCSTLYPAVLYADLEVLERSNHSLEVSYVPLGMDATVAWGSLDFKFKNSTNYPVKIQSSYGGGLVSISILGTKENKNKKVEIVTETVSYIPFTSVEVVKPELQPGTRIVDSNGFNGSTVNTYKVYYENGVEVSRKFIGKSVYRMAQKVWHVGPVDGEAVDDPLLTPEGETATEPALSPDGSAETSGNNPASTPAATSAPSATIQPSSGESGTSDKATATPAPVTDTDAPSSADEYPDGI